MGSSSPPITNNICFFLWLLNKKRDTGVDRDTVLVIMLIAVILVVVVMHRRHIVSLFVSSCRQITPFVFDLLSSSLFL
jgi:hypothetical protein